MPSIMVIQSHKSCCINISLKTPVVKHHTTLPLSSSFSIVIVRRLPVARSAPYRQDYVVNYTTKLSLNERFLPRNYHQSPSCDIYGQLSLFSLQEVAFVTMGVLREEYAHCTINGKTHWGSRGKQSICMAKWRCLEGKPLLNQLPTCALLLSKSDILNGPI